MSVRRLVAVLAVVVLLGGCERATGADDPSPALSPSWTPLTVPLPPGAPGRPLLRDAAACAGRWYVVGGVADATGATRPAAWSSADGSTFTPLALLASSHWGKRHVLSSVACRQGRAAAIGAKSGGAHGNPRVGTWAQGPDGVLREVPAPFERFGGPRAVGVSGLAAGPAGWLVVGNRVSGAAVWTSSDGRRFTLHEGLPQLSGDGRGRTLAYGAAAVPSGWLVVGAVLTPGAVPVAWLSADGRVWRRHELPAAAARGQAQRVAPVSGAVVAVGPVQGGRFVAWRDDGDGWDRVGGFGSAGRGSASVRALVPAGDALLAVTVSDDGHRLWSSVDAGGTWWEVALPVPVLPGGEATVGLAVQGDRLVLTSDRGDSARIWWTTLRGVLLRSAGG